MMHKSLIPFVFFLGVFLPLIPTMANGQDDIPTCTAMDRPCMMRQLESLIPQIDQADWRDQSYRELAKIYAYAGDTSKAIALIEKIQNQDTKAMTIRGIGMAAASLGWSRADYNTLFKRLSEEATEITHAPSQGIAYTYIAMAQAFSGDSRAARQTASTMGNAALRNKAYGETAEIDAARGDLKNALESLSAIDAPSYRHKAQENVSRIFLEKGFVTESFAIAEKIENPYLRSRALQRLLNKGNPEEQEKAAAIDMTKGMD